MSQFTTVNCRHFSAPQNGPSKFGAEQRNLLQIHPLILHNFLGKYNLAKWFLKLSGHG
jgi:hypothetical protein